MVNDVKIINDWILPYFCSISKRVLV